MGIAGVSANKLEWLQIAKAVAEEKAIDKQIVLAAIEEAFERAAKMRYGAELDIRAFLHPETGEMSLRRVMTVREEVENEYIDVDLATAQLDNPEAEIGTEINTPLPMIEPSRVQTHLAKQVITQKTREAERARQFEEFKDRIGEIINGIVKRVEYGHIIVDLGRAEAVIRRDQALPRENVKPGDRIRAYIMDVREEQRGSQIFLSRAHPQFMAQLFAQEVPEVYEGTIQIVAVARDPGSRAKIAVYSNDSSIDPVGACVGMRGSRVQAVVNELQGERIDIIPYTEDVGTFIVNALQPATVAKVVIHEADDRIEVVVPEEQLSLAIGRRGQNVRLASQLSGWALDILTEEQESERRQQEFRERSQLFMVGLDVDEMVAQLLVSEGFETMEEVGYVEMAELSSIEGFDDETAEELQTRAREYLEKIAQEQNAKRIELGVEDGVLEIDGVTLPMAVIFGENEIVSVEDVAGLVPDDLTGYVEFKDGEKIREPGLFEGMKFTAEEATNMIMRARVHAGWISEEDLYQDEEEAEGEEGANEYVAPERAIDAAEALFNTDGPQNKGVGA
ncbi:transcription termination/antitermination protein NusA [Algimonas ampicilliniresistens]|jgi:N utilization substance protein A|uniref:Transcription termination/antitermination protein NusA n=1 Tax=Algimonas ampicilliniresistens TaxID=1298735 RepID=A0ABQ5V982_9PROT|nr:transcription termination factor NusA [Algimonas ampicilliniresistens]GLQ24013.1 transcription termination/antitermination protein NusA [Algimonas ampicilliniresistens]